MNAEKEVHLRAPAKVNLILRVLDRLPNGYHNLWSLMQTVELTDSFRFRLNRNSRDITLQCDHADLPTDRSNLIYRAAELVLNRATIDAGVDITVNKRIPLAAGLGGGSSDAATTIVGLTRLFKLDWSEHNMAQLGATLGSDVPFFFSAPSAVIRGWGQDVTPVTVTGQRWMVLVNPGFPIETKWAYEFLSSTRGSVKPLAEAVRRVERMGSLSWEQVIQLMENDFEEALLPQYPQLARLKTDLLSAGAEAALLSGSGATVIGVFPDEATAVHAKESVNARHGGSAYAVQAASSPLITHDPSPLT